MIKPFAIALVILVAGCETQKPDDLELVQYRATERIKLFKECMMLAAKIERKADDDVSDIVSECSQSAYYMTNGLKAVPKREES